MIAHRFSPLPSALLLALALSAFMPGAARADAFAAACAQREIEVIALIEDHGNAGTVSSARLAEAGRSWLRARAICYLGRVDEAVALYDGIKTTLGPAKFGQR
jgi:hypothetical protein